MSEVFRLIDEFERKFPMSRQKKITSTMTMYILLYGDKGWDMMLKVLEDGLPDVVKNNREGSTE